MSQILSILRVAMLTLSAVHALEVMSPLQPDTTCLDVPSGDCVSYPGDSNPVCTDIGVVANASVCSAACDALYYCSSMTYHDLDLPIWGGHCVLRKDGVWIPRACGAGCGHTAAQKTSGWRPYTVVWPPSLQVNRTRILPMWFGANETGLDNAETLGLMAAHAVAGYGWQQGFRGSVSVGRGEASLSSAVTHVADYLASISNPNNTVLFMYRQIQVALRLFALEAIAADEPANDGFWLHDKTTGDLCVAAQPWGTSDPYWDWRNASAVQYWVDQVIGELASEPSLNGGAVFFDEVDQATCGYRSGTCDFSQFIPDGVALQNASNAMLVQMVAALNAANIVPILSLDNRMTASSNGLSPSPMYPCAVGEEALVAALSNYTWVRFYENWPSSFWVPDSKDLRASMIANAILEAEAGVPNILHANANCPAPVRNITRPGPLGGDVEYQVASYLIVSSPGSMLSLSSGWLDDNFCWRPDFDVEYGVPLGPAIRTGPYSWTRSYSQCNASLDLNAGVGNVYLF